MNASETNDLIGNRSVSGDIGDDAKAFFSEVIDTLDGGGFETGNFHGRGFEGSFVEGAPKVRLLHLEFPAKSSGKSEIRKMRSRREVVVIDILRKGGERFSCRYDIGFCEKFFAFNEGNGAFPVQVGLECEASGKPRIKAYLSVNADDFPLEEFCALADIGNVDTIRFLKDKRFDTVAVDFLPDGRVAVKFYPLISENKGLLVRISDDGSMYSKKSWIRFPQGIDIGNVSKSGFFDVPLSLRDHMAGNGLKVHYLCLENGKGSVYFR